MGMNNCFIYRVHGYYKKYDSRKPENKIEATVFASDANKAQELVVDLFSKYPAELSYFTASHEPEPRSLEQLYKEIPELHGENPDQGYVFNKYYLLSKIACYFK